MTAEEILNKIPDYNCVIRNADYDMRKLRIDFDTSEKKLNECKKEREEALIGLGMIEETIKAMPTRTYREMLKRHYLDGQTWQEVAENMTWSLTQIYTFRPRALDEFQKTLENIQENIVKCIE